ncbi:MAG: peptidoglycan DD-metalloendopeptidase family protein [Deltaproteobacteria bacterium]|nr:peptidoglycan DD-metalloendopeptidase family protein [Deltaproteobacteria bacterium]
MLVPSYQANIKKLAVIIFGLGFLVYFIILFFSVPFTPSEMGKNPPISAKANAETTLPPQVVELKIKKNDTIFSLLSSFQVSPGRIDEIVSASQDIYNLRTIKAGSDIKFFLNNNEFKALKLPMDNSNYLVIEERQKKISARKEPIPYETNVKVAAGTIKNSLYEDGLSSGLSPDIVMNLSDVFAWEIDFASDIKQGDNFRVLYETKYLEGRLAKNGRILAAQFENNGKLFHAVYFADKDGKGGYYDLNGRSLAKQFLKSPLNYRRISSYFSTKRFHPILKIYRPHHGIDYSAQKGTPVAAIGDGRVEFIGWKSDYGKLIVIRHNNTYSTAYGHLNSFANKLKKGSAVKQGQVIAYVGSTGLATGPHLHYEFRKNNRFVNPLNIDIPPAMPVKTEYISAFEKTRDDVIKKLSSGVVAVAQK